MKPIRYHDSHFTSNEFPHKNKENLSLIDFNKTLHIINAEIRKEFAETRRKKILNETKRKKSMSRFSHERTSSLDLLYFENQSVSKCLKEDFFRNVNEKHYRLQNDFKVSFSIKKDLRKTKKEKNSKVSKNYNATKSCLFFPQNLENMHKPIKYLSNLLDLKEKNKDLRFRKTNTIFKVNTFLKSSVGENDFNERPKTCQNNKNLEFLHTIAKKKPLNERKLTVTEWNKKIEWRKEKKISPDMENTFKTNNQIKITNKLIG